ncbi:uncharacterized protein YgbK (DUF1537 family) [Aliiruegeria haliotis]|uniref:3-oxo-tetronate kinase n=1 Tax=Aliiruegeria haliotis TaxID=1280846 RepID=A0A2T0RII5_9RHOB|nr:3-oxo-tetronate kinase [Aliiruegeria haliotis]PRY20932.1 uncharacterized protein YgbK (DUF1537 family) [Aliiruegeria haliotis]
MKLGVIADDFTGASDIALALAEGGMATVQYGGLPDGPADKDVQAGVIALKCRTILPKTAVEQTCAAADWLLAQGAEQIIYKVCSTFDSTREGNIGPVAQALAEKLGETAVLVCPAFPENGRSVYQGHLFVADTLLSDSGMRNHPLTPMTDPDLRRWLAHQTSWPVAHLPAATVFQGAGAARAALATHARAMVIGDAIRDEDLRTLGAAAKGRRLLVGGSGIALGLPANWDIAPAPIPWDGEAGPGVVLSGSCSVATRGQVETYSAKAATWEITAEAAMAGNIDIDEVSEWVLAQDTAPLIYSSADPKKVSAAQKRFGREESAEAIETLFARLAARLAEKGIGRIVTAGGETSGAVTQALGADRLRIGPRIAAGVPALRVDGRPLVLALKSGNFGGPDFFAEALTLLKG